MADALDLQGLCDDFLAACEAALDTIPTFEPGLAGAPARSFVSGGQPQYDCCEDGQLSVHVPFINSDPVQPLKNQERRNIVGLTATILRCVPSHGEDAGPIEPEDLEAAAEQINADGWALWNHIFGLVRSGELFTLCDPVLWDGLRSITPSGSCAGWTLNMRVNLFGY